MNPNFYEELQKTPHFKNPEEEIAFLRSQLENQNKQESTQISPEVHREKIADSLVEVYKTVPTHELIHDNYALEEHELEGISLHLKPEEHDTVIEDLYSFMLDNGIKNTLYYISKIGNPHIEDDFHRFLIQYLAGDYEVPGLQGRKNLAKALDLRIFEITLPNPKGDSEEHKFKEITTLMEQFMAGMQSIADDRLNKTNHYYTLELSISEDEDDMSLYVTVPKHRGHLFEKQIFPFRLGHKFLSL